MDSEFGASDRFASDRELEEAEAATREGIHRTVALLELVYLVTGELPARVPEPEPQGRLVHKNNAPGR